MGAMKRSRELIEAMTSKEELTGGAMKMRRS
jgi:hypothetical protein